MGSGSGTFRGVVGETGNTESSTEEFQGFGYMEAVSSPFNPLRVFDGGVRGT